jgi:hypothetical protein
MMDDDFNIDDFMEESNDQFNAKLEEWKERMMIDAIEANYQKLEENGISDLHLRNMETDEIQNLCNTLKIMLEHYEDLEEYEKCKVVFDCMKKVEQVFV